MVIYPARRARIRGRVGFRLRIRRRIGGKVGRDCKVGVRYNDVRGEEEAVSYKIVMFS